MRVVACKELGTSIAKRALLLPSECGVVRLPIGQRADTFVSMAWLGLWGKAPDVSKVEVYFTKKNIYPNRRMSFSNSFYKNMFITFPFVDNI